MSKEPKEKEIASHEEMVAFYTKELELAKLRRELSRLQRDTTIFEAERMNAIGAISQMRTPPAPVTKPDHSDGDQENR